MKNILKTLEKYKSEHTTLGCQITHIFGIPMIIVSPFLAFLVDLRAGLYYFIAGWLLQFIGHYVFERNHPFFIQQLTKAMKPDRVDSMIHIEEVDLKNMMRHIWLCAGNSYRLLMDEKLDEWEKDREETISEFIKYYREDGSCGVSYSDYPCSCELGSEDK